MTPPIVRVGALCLAVGAIALAVVLGRGPQEPYVISAIDYHFHDAHPTQPIARGRDLIVSNVGGNLHNVTIPVLDYSRDVQPGQRLVLRDVASLFDGPGRYSMVCLYHEDRGMTGTIVVGEE